MSAWIVTKDHIDLMVDAAIRYAYGREFHWYTDGDGGRATQHELTYSNADEVGQMLLDENVKSVSYRYPNDQPSELPGPTNSEWMLPYVFPSFYGARYSPVEALKQIACYEYQSCEHPEWGVSSARAFCRQLTQQMITALPGYDDAPWGWDALPQQPVTA